MQDAPFRVLAKHRQARVHLETFTQAVRTFLSETPVRTEGKLTDDHLEYVVRVYDIKPVPEEISLLAGDVVHNCRACLDHLAWEISRNPSIKTSFPIHTSQGDRDPAIAGGISDAHQRVLNSAQPYVVYPEEPRNALLAILKNLDNTDKHRLLLTSVSAMHANSHGQPYRYRGDTPESEYFWGELKEGAIVAKFRFTEPSPDMYMSDFQVIPSVSLAEIGVQQDVVDAGELLWRIHEDVWELVVKFEPF